MASRAMALNASSAPVPSCLSVTDPLDRRLVRYGGCDAYSLITCRC